MPHERDPSGGGDQIVPLLPRAGRPRSVGGNGALPTGRALPVRPRGPAPQPGGEGGQADSVPAKPYSERTRRRTGPTRGRGRYRWCLAGGGRRPSLRSPRSRPPRSPEWWAASPSRTTAVRPWGGEAGIPDGRGFGCPALGPRGRRDLPRRATGPRTDGWSSSLPDRLPGRSWWPPPFLSHRALSPTLDAGLLLRGTESTKTVLNLVGIPHRGKALGRGLHDVS